jgi:hypothetical protein
MAAFSQRYLAQGAARKGILHPDSSVETRTEGYGIHIIAVTVAL